ncbi:hypothetical protein CTAYLR_002263 [Chrysophaeum taylorii]|uniref:Uncharacterized protein n=1 Tax=Chrysophaeum taylorii TaxID=2483200 RepID=A0AAD7UNH8_9STRA|nr:hypothetical protein CTAYLR_002263 [Chrysophaeum taylorii]
MGGKLNGRNHRPAFQSTAVQPQDEKRESRTQRQLGPLVAKEAEKRNAGSAEARVLAAEAAFAALSASMVSLQRETRRELEAGEARVLQHRRLQRRHLSRQSVSSRRGIVADVRAVVAKPNIAPPSSSGTTVFACVCKTSRTPWTGNASSTTGAVRTSQLSSSLIRRSPPTAESVVDLKAHAASYISFLREKMHDGHDHQQRETEDDDDDDQSPWEEARPHRAS